MYGNKCGHRPDYPRWYQPPKQHTRPQIINKMIAEIRLYYAEPATIPSLNLANGSARQQRSERREACLSVLSCLLHYLDLATLRVGIPQHDASFKGITMPFIAAKSGLPLRRTERAVADLVQAGLISVHPLCEKISDCIYKGHAAIRAFNRKLFTLFGLGGRLKYERDRAAARMKKRLRKTALKAKAKVDLLMEAAGNSRADAPEIMQTRTENHGTRAEQLKSIKQILNST